MKKIPTLFEREFRRGKVVEIKNKVTPGMEWVLEGKGIATIKMDGSCCAIIGGELYKRYDAKHGKKPPEGAIPCCPPDPITSHHPHWVKVDPDAPADKWFVEAFNNAFHDSITEGRSLPNRTYEAVGPHFNGNPHNYRTDTLIPHGCHSVHVERTFEGIRQYLAENNVEGLVFWLNNEPMCKIKRSDFGFEWPMEV